MKKTPQRKTAILMALAVFTGSITSCFGRFPVTSLVYEVNDGVSESLGGSKVAEAIESIVMWIFAILPVYGLAILGDVIIFNLIEFWTGDSIEISSTTTEDGRLITFAPTEDKDIAELTIEKDGVLLSKNQIVRVSETECEVRMMDGSYAGSMIREKDGSMTLVDQSGQQVAMLGYEDINQILNSQQQAIQ